MTRENGYSAKPRGLPFVAHQNEDLSFTIVAAGKDQVEEYLSAKDRLERALTYWREHNLIATKATIKSIANKFGVHPKSLSEALKLLGSEEN